MAIVKIIDENRTVTDRQAVAEYLTPRGVRYEYWTPAHAVEPANASVVVLLIRLGLAMNDEPAARRWIKELQGMAQAEPREVASVIELYRDQFQRELR